MNDLDLLISLKVKSVLPYYGFSLNAICLLFLKYLRVKEYAAKFNESLDKDKLSINTVHELLNKVEEENGLKKNALKNAFFDISLKITNQEIIKYLKTDLIEYSKQEKEDLIYNIISFADKDTSKTNIYTTNRSLITLVDKILDVKESESFMNTFSGFNIASINIEAEKYLGYELEVSVYSLSLLIMIFLNKKNINISNDDIYLVSNIEKVDKILTDGPWGVFPDKLKYIDRSKVSNKMEYHNIDITINALNDNGKAVVVVPNKLLISDTYKLLRESLVTNHYLEAVVSLPVLSNQTLVNPYLLILSKKDNKEVYFVEGNRKEFYIQNKKVYNLTDEGIGKILQGISKETSCSKRVSISDLLDQKDMSLLVPNYVFEEKDETYSKKEEIEEKLKKLYSKFNDLIN